jgi:hypothetical protein
VLGRRRKRKDYSNERIRDSGEGRERSIQERE